MFGFEACAITLWCLIPNHYLLLPCKKWLWLKAWIHLILVVLTRVCKCVWCVWLFLSRGWWDLLGREAHLDLRWADGVLGHNGSARQTPYETSVLINQPLWCVSTAGLSRGVWSQRWSRPTCESLCFIHLLLFSMVDIGFNMFMSDKRQVCVCDSLTLSYYSLIYIFQCSWKISQSSK